MKDKINIAELLRDCPKGMELDCTMFENVTLCRVDNNERAIYPITVLRGDGNSMILTKYGQCSNTNSAKCVIFPKGKTTWDGFVPPCKFKDGDVVFYNDTIAIFKEWGDETLFRTYVIKYLYNDFAIIRDVPLFGKSVRREIRFATEEEKKKLFDAIKAHGYQWNADTKTLEKLVKPRFKVGDRIKKKYDTRLITIKDIRDDYYIITIPNFFDNAYITDKLLFSNQDEYKIIPNKFDITTLQPFESKVLVRDMDTHNWIGAFYSHYSQNGKKFHIIGGSYYFQCIPYKGNEHLLDTTNDCDEFYKTW